MNTQEATVSLWGKSTAIRIPAAIAKQSALRIGQSVRIENAIDGSITIRPVIESPNLETLLAGVTKQNMPDVADVSWGKPVGSGAWWPVPRRHPSRVKLSGLILTRKAGSSMGTGKRGGGLRW